jgi:hypothetical protein
MCPSDRDIRLDQRMRSLAAEVALGAYWLRQQGGELI